MKMHPFACLFRKIFRIVFLLDVMLVFVGVGLALVLRDTRAAYVCLLIGACAVACLAFSELVFFLIDTYGKHTITFAKDCVSYRGRQYALSDISIRYFKFQWTFLESDLVVPRIVLVFPNASRVVLYMTKRQKRRFQAMLHEWITVI